MLYYGHEISPNQTETVEGFLICKNVPIARIGPMDYLAQDLNLDGDPYRKITVNRYQENVFEDAALASFEGKPVTDGHPPESVEPANYGAYTKGHVQNVRRSGDFMVADLYINDQSLISDIKNGVKREVSCGYLCNWEPDAGEGYKQTNIRGNHVAVVPKGRAGHEVSIKDAATHGQQKGGNKMGEFRKNLLHLFGISAKDAAPEELEELVNTTLTALDAEPVEKTPEAEPANDEDTDVNSKMDEILRRLDELEKKNDREEKKLSDESDLDELIEKLSGGEKLEKDPAAAATIPVKEDDACVRTGDAAVEMLKKVRPVVAAIENKEERARVADALISVFTNDGKMGDILTATRDSAAEKTKQNPKSYDEVCKEQKSVYDSLNPHKNKEVK